MEIDKIIERFQQGLKDDINKEYGHMRYEYRTFGIHVIIVPKEISVVAPEKYKELTPVATVISDKELEGWKLVQVIPGFNIALPAQNNISIPGRQNQPLVLPGACVIMRRTIRNK